VTAPSAAGTQLLQEQLAGSTKVITSGTGFSVVNDVVTAGTDRGTVTTYDAAGNKLTTIGNVDADCGAADIVLPSGRRVILALTHKDQPAQGVNPATITVRLNEFDALTSRQLWSTDLIAGSTDTDDTSIVCNLPTSDGSLTAFSPTVDGGFAVDSESAPGKPSWIVNLTTGAVRPSTTAVEALGSVIVNQGSDDPSIYFSDPATGARTGTLAGITDPNDLDFGTDYATKTSLIWVIPLGGDQYKIQSLSLPDAKPAWAVTQPPFEVSDLSATGSILIASNHYETATGIVAYNLSTGKHLWTQPNTDFCGAYNGKVVVAVNGQLATLDAGTGKQVSFDSQQSGCPTILPNGIAWNSAGDGTITVQQYL
jgi:hypothetical protein